MKILIFLLCLSLTGCANIARGLSAAGNTKLPETHQVDLTDQNGNRYSGTMR